MHSYVFIGGGGEKPQNLRINNSSSWAGFARTLAPCSHKTTNLFKTCLKQEGDTYIRVD